MTHRFAVSDFFVYLKNVRAEATAVKYLDAANHFLNYCKEKNLPFDHLPPNVMGGFVSWLVEKGLAPRSVNVYVAGARSYLRWCEGHGLATPVHMHADLPKAANPASNALREESVLAYIREASKLHEPYRSALLLLPYCGLRSNELANLTVKSVKRVALPLRGQGAHKDHLCFVVWGKGNEMRVVPLLLDGVGIFIDYMRNWRANVNGGEWLFPAGGGIDPIATRTLRFFCQQIRERVPSLSKLTPHVLRDTYATALWKCGVDIPTLTRIVGHKNIQTTYDHYLDIQDEDAVKSIVVQDARLIMPNAAARPARLVEALRATRSSRP